MRKYKCRYEVYIVSPDYSIRLGSFRKFKTFKRANKYSLGLCLKTDEVINVTRIFFKHGVRWERQFTR
jgi:hypothetical protein